MHGAYRSYGTYSYTVQLYSRKKSYEYQVLSFCSNSAKRASAVHATHAIAPSAGRSWTGDTPARNPRRAAAPPAAQPQC